MPTLATHRSNGASQEVVRWDVDYISEKLGDELETMSGSRLLITGGAGFLGHYLVQSVLNWNEGRAAESRIELVVLDNFQRGLPDWLRRWSDDPALELLEHDIRAPLPAEVGDFDYIIHAASIASPTYYRMHPIVTMDANVQGLRWLLDHAREQADRGSPIAGFLFFSTSEIYGDPPPTHIPTPETYRGNVSCTGPRACYDESKRYGETLCVNFARAYGLPITIARPFNNFGPGLKITDGRVLPDFARDVLAGRDIVLHSDGSPTRTFCYVADAVVGYYKVLVRGRAGEAYNIGVEEPEISMLELAERVANLARQLFGYGGSVKRLPNSDPEYLTDNPTRRCPVITKAREELDYRPGISLEEGLRRTLIWYSDNREAEAS